MTDLGNFAWNTPLVASFGNMAWECFLVDTLTTLPGTLWCQFEQNWSISASGGQFVKPCLGVPPGGPLGQLCLECLVANLVKLV